MHLSQQWRILTIGDGDLSFSLAIAKQFNPARLTATVLDSESTLRDKYALHAIDELTALGCDVLFNVDITDHETFSSRLSQEYDIVIFQFPLVPNAGPNKPGRSYNHSDDSNLQNRLLLASTLENSFKLLLDPKGSQLCFITSKDVKPYCDWNIEGLADHLGIPYLGSMPFNQQGFKGYRLRNVDRDKQVKSTSAITYVWGKSLQPEICTHLTRPPAISDTYCSLCGVGPFMTDRDRQAHLNSRQHTRREGYQTRWEAFLQKGE